MARRRSKSEAPARIDGLRRGTGAELLVVVLKAL
jgi:hypothetical protein